MKLIELLSFSWVIDIHEIGCKGNNYNYNVMKTT